ncbi:hypothetical protein ACCO45_012541 [Purpureocillium lilacinum]|uniref:Uncharacterized protein n=1 Tax=Purpureocillium lilacinum TaxID=33203 RepID=A0ACC4DBD1_PURLI
MPTLKPRDPSATQAIATLGFSSEDEIGHVADEAVQGIVGSADGGSDSRHKTLLHGWIGRRRQRAGADLQLPAAARSSVWLAPLNEMRARGRASPLSQVDSPCWPQASTPQGTRPAAWSRLQRARAGVAFEWELRAAVPQKAAGPRRRSSSHEAGESLAGAAPWIVTEAELVCHNMHRGSVDPWVGEVGDVTPAMVARGGLSPGTTASNAPALHGSGRDPAERWLSLAAGGASRKPRRAWYKPTDV